MCLGWFHHFILIYFTKTTALVTKSSPTSEPSFGICIVFNIFDILYSDLKKLLTFKYIIFRNKVTFFGLSLLRILKTTCNQRLKNANNRHLIFNVCRFWVRKSLISLYSYFCFIFLSSNDIQDHRKLSLI